MIFFLILKYFIVVNVTVVNKKQQKDLTKSKLLLIMGQLPKFTHHYKKIRPLGKRVGKRVGQRGGKLGGKGDGKR